MSDVQKCFDDIFNSTRMVAGLGREVENMREAMCAAFIRSQSDVLRLSVAKPDELKNRTMDALAAIVRMSAAFEDGTRTLADRLSIESDDLLAAQQAAVRLYNSVNDEVRKANSKIGALEKRLMEHSSNDPAVRELVWQMTGGLCFYCDIQLVKASPLDPSNPGPDGSAFHVDHIVPRHLGGPDHISNFAPACHRCNCAKGTKSIVEFTRKKQARLSVIEGGAAQSGGSK